MALKRMELINHERSTVVLMNKKGRVLFFYKRFYKPNDFQPVKYLFISISSVLSQSIVVHLYFIGIQKYYKSNYSHCWIKLDETMMFSLSVCALQ